MLVGLFRGLHCAFCRRHIAAQAQLDPALREKGVESLTVVNTPIDRARLYFRYHPMPNLLAAADPERASHRAFGLPNLEFTENETVWPYKVSTEMVLNMRVDVPGELPPPVDPLEAGEILNKKDGYEITEADQQMLATGTASSSASSCWTGKASSAGVSPRFRKAESTCSARRTREELMSAASQVSQ